MARISDREIREKLMISGAGTLSDAELLSVVIREGTCTTTALELSEAMLAQIGGSLGELAEAGVSRVRQLAGCGTIRAISVVAAAELARRITVQKADRVNTIGSMDDVIKLFAPLVELPHEEFWAVYLTSGGRVIDKVRLSQGGVSGTVVDCKLVVKRAIELLAGSLILVHNHPSGVAKPSAEDVDITENVSRAAALFDIKVIDHVIVTGAGAYSFAENRQI